MSTDAVHRNNNTQPLLPIGKVVERVRRTYPAVSRSSLRFLEREGLIASERTPGGHRLYAEADVERILQIKAWQSERLSLEDIRQRLRQRDHLPDPGELSRTFVEHVLAGRSDAARRTILAADDVGMPLWQLFGDVIQPALVEIGHGWERSTVLVAQEKTASELVRDLIGELSHRHTAGETHEPVIVAACVAGERHELGLRMIVGLLRAEGFRVHYLGADVETRFLIEATRLYQPAVVLLSARTASHRATLQTIQVDMHDALAIEDQPLLIAGGHIASGHEDDLRSWGVIPITHEHPAKALAAIMQIIAASSATPGLTGEP